MANRIHSKIKNFFYYGSRNFTDYAQFLDVAKKKGFRLCSMMEYAKKEEPSEKAIGLPHDIDSSLNHAMKMAVIEHSANVKATYFVLHTAKYFYQNIPKGIINKKLIPKLLYLQNTLGHEIGLHLDLMPIELIYKMDPFKYLENLLEYLRREGINISGVSPHGNLFTNLFRKDYQIPSQDIKNHIFINPHTEFDLKMFKLSYEISSLDHDVYFCDSIFIDQKRWDFSFIERSFFNTNNRTIILIHPIHWSDSIFIYYTKNLFLTVKYSLEYLNQFYKYWRTK